MPATFKNGQFEINDNGDFVFLDENDNTVFQYNTTTGNLELGKAFDVSSNQILNAILGTALNANSNDINNVGALGATSGTFSGAVSADSASVTNGVSAGSATVSGAVDAGSVEGDSYTVGDNSALLSVAASGQVTLASGTATVDTGISAVDATFYLALGVDDPNADTNLAGKLFWDDTAGTYKVTIDEVDTAVGNPTANYDILRVR